MLQALLLIMFAATASQAAGDGGTKPEPAKERLVCKRETPIGSLIARRKVCLTKSEWDKRTADGNDEARNQIYNNQGRPACTSSATC